MPDKFRILCTRRMPPNVEARLVRDYDATLDPEDRLYSAEDLVAGSENRDGIFCAGGDPPATGAGGRPGPLGRLGRGRRAIRCSGRRISRRSRMIRRGKGH